MEAYRENAVLESAALWRLVGFLRQQRQAWGSAVPDLEQFERELHAHVLAFERELLAYMRSNHAPLLVYSNGHHSTNCA